jgi:hypothetical protein
MLWTYLAIRVSASGGSLSASIAGSEAGARRVAQVSLGCDLIARGSNERRVASHQ